MHNLSKSEKWPKSGQKGQNRGFWHFFTKFGSRCARRSRPADFIRWVGPHKLGVTNRMRQVSVLLLLIAASRGKSENWALGALTPTTPYKVDLRVIE